MYHLAFLSKEGVFSLILVFFPDLRDILSEVLQHCLFKGIGQDI